MQRTITTLIDDTDGSEAAETVRFSLDSIAYEVDLNKQHAEDLRGELALYIEHARELRASRANVTVPLGRGRNTGSVGGPDIAAERIWLREHGYAVGRQGRISTALHDAYLSKTPAPLDPYLAAYPAADDIQERLGASIADESGLSAVDVVPVAAFKTAAEPDQPDAEVIPLSATAPAARKRKSRAKPANNSGEESPR
jgi:hypothetical protein